MTNIAKIYTIMTLILLVSCKKEVQPDMIALNENCNCAKEVSANFLIEEMTSPFSDARFTDADTIYKGKNVRFRALEDNAQYTWYIGNEVLNTQEVARFFNSSLGGQNITISLAIRKKPNSICLPNDDGYDSISKTFHVSTKDPGGFFVDPNFLEGTFRLASAEIDSMDVIIDISSTAPNPPFLSYVVTVIGLTNDTLNFPVYDRNYREFWFDQNYGYSYMSYFRRNLNGEVEFLLKPNEGITYPIPFYHLTGRKIN